MRKRALLLVLTLVLALCSNLAIAASNEVTLTVWCWDPAFNIYAMQEAAKIYARINPNVKIDIVETPWEDVQTKVTTAAMSGQLGTLPDILLMQDNALTKNVINYPGLFLDLTDRIDFSNFADFKVALCTVDGRIYGVPFDNGAAINALRTDVLAQAGYTLDDFTNITWSEYIRMGKDILAKTGKPLASTVAESPDYIMFGLQSAGSWMFDENGEVNIANNKVLKELIEIYVELVKSGVLVQVNDWEQYISSFNRGTVAGTMNGCWIIGSIVQAKDQAGKWGITNIPRLERAPGATNYSNQGGSSWMVLASSKNADVAVDFLKHTFAGSVELYETILPSSGALATYLPAGDSDVYNEPHPFFAGQRIYADITDYASKVPEVKYSVYNYEARDAIGVAIGQVLAGRDIDSALQEAEDTVRFLMGP